MSIQSNFPAIKPSLLLDFANTETLDPRITFTRATTATYYDGVTTAMAEQNLVTYSQTFSNAAWVASNVTVGAVTTAPDGTSTAYPLTASAGNGTLLQTFTATATAYTFSIYIQRVTGTGNIDITVDGVTYATQTTTGTWTRFNVTTTPAAGSKIVGIRLVTSGDVVNIWGAQLEQRSSVTAYTATTTQPITNYIPVLKTAASGVARFDHNPITGESLGLLIEEQRTNLLTYSEQFDNAAWTQGNSNITANTIISPDGTLTGDLLIPNSSTATHTVRPTSSSAVSGNTGTNSIFVKAAGYSKVGIREASVTGNWATFNLSTGAVIASSGVTNPVITLVGNGWYRISVTDSAATQRFTIYAMNDSYASGSPDNYTFAGNGYSGIYIWGAQLEAGAFATSYIPTVASTVTRNADAASMTGANFSSWFSADAFTTYADFISNGYTANQMVFSYTISGSSTANPLQVYFSGSTTLTLDGWGSATIAKTVAQNTAYKYIVGAQLNNFGASLNADAISSDTTVGPAQPYTQFNIGNRNGSLIFNGTIKKLAYYPVRLSNTNLQALTS